MEAACTAFARATAPAPVERGRGREGGREGGREKEIGREGESDKTNFSKIFS